MGQNGFHQFLTNSNPLRFGSLQTALKDYRSNGPSRTEMVLTESAALISVALDLISH
jgi:hypothetical protein